MPLREFEIVPSGGTLSQSNESYVPYNTYYHDNRMQFVLLASELQTAGLRSGDRIVAIKFQCGTLSLPGRDLVNFRIRLQNTDQATSTAWVTSGWTLVYGPTTISKTLITSGNWFTHELHTPFTWDGRNLLVDTSRDDTAWASRGSNYTYSGLTNRACGTYHDSSTSWPYDSRTPRTLSYILRTILVVDRGNVVLEVPAAKCDTAFSPPRILTNIANVQPPPFNVVATMQNPLGVGVGGLAKSPWPKAGGPDLRNTCIQPKHGTPLLEPQVRWRVLFANPDALSVQSPVLDLQGDTYIGDLDGYLTVLDKGGNIKWRRLISPAGTEASVTIDSFGTIYLPTEAEHPGQLYALDPYGNTRWVVQYYGTYPEYDPLDAFNCAVTLDDTGTVYTVNDSGQVWAINLDGSVKWVSSETYSGLIPYGFPPTVDVERDTIYTIGALYLVAHQTNGQLKWLAETSSGSWNPIVDNQGDIYVVGHNGYVASFQPNGSLKWGGNYYTGLRNLADALGLNGEFLVGSDDYGLYAFDPYTGEVQWVLQRSDWILGLCVSSSGVIYGHDRDDYIFAATHEGVLLWEFDVWSYFTDSDGVASNYPILDDKGTLYFTEWGGQLTALIVEAVAFTVESTNPTQGAVDVDPSVSVQVTFSDSLDTSTVNESSVQIKLPNNELVTYIWFYDDATKTLTLDPVYPLPGGTQITVELTSGVASTSGVSLTPYSFSFTTKAFEVTSTDPPAGASGVDPDSKLRIMFSDSLDTATVGPETVIVRGSEPEPYVYSWEYDVTTKMLTLTVEDGLETDTLITVQLTSEVKSTSGATLTPYEFSFTTGKLPLKCEPPSILAPFEARSEQQWVVIQLSVPNRKRAKWKLYPRVRVYTDRACTQLLTEVDGNVEPSRFQYSVDSGETWLDMKTEGLGPLLYGCLARTKVSVGAGTVVWIKVGVGAEDA